MKLRKTMAFLTALTAAASVLVLPASGAEVFGDIDGDGAVGATDAAWILQYAAYTGAGGTLDLRAFVNGEEEQPPETPEITDTDDTLTILVWNDSDISMMQECYLAEYPDANIEVRNIDGAGSDAAENFRSILNSGEQIDLYIAEADWVRSYIDYAEYAAPISAIGLTEEDYADGYDYAVELCRNKNGDLCGASYLIAPGGYCYNTDIAEEYLGITTPEEMQARISDWDGFTAAAADLHAASQGSITMTATLGGMWTCFSRETTIPVLKDGLLNTEMQESFTELAKTWIAGGYVDPSVYQWSAEWTNIGLNGSTMGYFYPTWGLRAGSMLEESSGAAGNWAIVAGPQEYYWGSGILCLSPTCNSASEAEQFLRYFTVDADSMQTFAEYSGYMVNNQTVTERIMASGEHSNPLLGGQDEYTVLHETAKNLDFKAAQASEWDIDLNNMFFPILRSSYDMTTEEIMTMYKDDAFISYGIVSAETE